MRQPKSAHEKRNSDCRQTNLKRKRQTLLQFKWNYVFTVFKMNCNQKKGINTPR